MPSHFAKKDKDKAGFLLYRFVLYSAKRTILAKLKSGSYDTTFQLLEMLFKHFNSYCSYLKYSVTRRVEGV